jgi:hypothetical protein
MTSEIPPIQLTDEQKKDICMVVGVGCDRETAAKYARTTWVALHEAMNLDREFATEVRYKEAVVELQHMYQLREASKKEANWRASVWWLEALAPERYGPRGTGLVNTRQLKIFLEHVSTTLVVEVHNDEDRERLLAALKHAAEKVDQLLRDESLPERSVTAANLLAQKDDVVIEPLPISADDSATNTNDQSDS